MTRFRKCSCTWLVVAVAAVLCLGGVRAADELKLKPAPQAVSGAEDPVAGDVLHVVPGKPLKRIVRGSTESSADGATNFHAENIGATVSGCRGFYGDNAILDAGSNPNPLSIQSAEFTVESTSFAFCAVPGGSTVCSDTNAVCNSAADCPTGVCSNKNVYLHLVFYDTVQNVVGGAPGIDPLRTYVFFNLNDPATCGPDCLAAENPNQDGIATYLFLFDLASADLCYDEAGLVEPCSSLDLSPGGDDPTPDNEVFVERVYRSGPLPTDPVDIDITLRFSTNPPSVGASDQYVWRNQDFSANGLELEAGTEPDGGCLNGTCDRRNLGGSPVDWMLHLRGLADCTTPFTCNDNNPCTDDTCDPITGCIYTPDDANLCSDGNGCTNDQCSNGSCIGTAIDCDDHDPCTADACDPSGFCVYTPTACPTGACCTLPGCQVTTQSQCVVLGGNYAGDGVTCLAANCPTSAVLQEPGCRSSKNPLPGAPSNETCSRGGGNCGGPVSSEDPVYLFSGEFYQANEDLRIPGRGLDFVWARKYRSRIGQLTALGNGWDFSYNIAIASTGIRPGEVLNLRWPNKQTLSWDQPADPGGSLVDLRYCSLRSTLASNFASTGTTLFVESDGVDQTSTDATNPVSRSVFFYLISAKNVGGEGPLGNDSAHNPRAGLPCGATPGDLVLQDGDTRRDTFKLQPDGSRTAPQLFQVLTQNPDGTLQLTFPDKGTWNFFALDHSRKQGKIASIGDRNGNALSFQYDAQGRLVTVTDTLGRNIQVGYDANGFIASVMDFAGRQVLYTHYNDGDAGGSFGDLKSVTTPAVTGTPTGNDFPAGKTTIYTYSTGFGAKSLLNFNQLNHNLLTITDPKSQTRLTNVYSTELNPAQLDFDRVARQVLGSPGDYIDYVYVAQTPAAPNNYASLKTIVNDRVGNVKEYFFNAANRDVMLREFTGRADPDQPTTDTVNRPTGQLRAGDPPFFETRWSYNEDAQVSGIITPTSSHEELTYDQGNPARRSQGNLLRRCTTSGPLGGDQAQICESFEYDAAFGSCCGTNFVTRKVDGRGNETLHSYDARGNRIHTQHEIPSVVEDFEYNGFGQMTAQVLPDNGSGHRQRDEYTYYASGPQRGYLQQSIVDATGAAITTALEYDLVGNVIRSIDPRGHDTLYTVNQLNQTVRETSREVEPGSGIRYQKDTYFDANDNVVRTDVRNLAADGVLQANTTFTTVIEYETLDRPIRACQEVGTYTGAIPGPPGLPTCIGLPAAEFITEEAQYDGNRNLVLLRQGEAVEGRQPANVVAVLHDERDLLFRTVRAPGDLGQSTDQYDYDGNRNLTRFSKGLENSPQVSLNSYDGYGRLIGTVDPMGNTTTTRYDAASNPVLSRTEGEPTDVSGSSSNVRLTEETYFYDAMNRVIREEEAFFDLATQGPIGSGRAVTETFYTPNSKKARMVDDNGHESLYTYDTANRLATTTDAKGNTVTHGYDANSNRVSVTEVEVSDLGSPSETFVTTNAYDGLDRMTSTTDSAGDQQHYLYDSRDNRTVEVDAKGNVTRYVFDGESRPILTELDLTDTGDGTGSVTSTIRTQQSWDDSSRLVAETDDNGNTTTYANDALNRLVSTTLADATNEQRTYDVHGNVVSSTDANGTVTATIYDLLDRVSTRAITRAVGVLGTTAEAWSYDGLSRVVLAQDDDTVVTLKFDSLGSIVEETQKIGAGPTRVLTGTFDGEGNRTSVTYPSGRTYTSTFDELDRTKSISDPAPVATHEYIGPDRVERRDHGNGTRTTLSYDAASRVTRTRHEKIAPLTVLDDRSYVWDPMFNKISRTDLRPGGVASTYGYDSAYRLKIASDSDGTTNYTYDGVGNRTLVTGSSNPGSYTMGAALPVPADFQTNQYTTTPREPVRTYDEDGELTQFGDRVGFGLGPNGCPGLCGVDDDGNGTTDDDCEVCPRNAAGQDVALGDDTCSGGHPRPSVADYDYLNQMVQFRLQSGCGTPETYVYDAFGRRLKAGSTEYFLDGDREIEERNAGGVVIAIYVYGDHVDEVIRQERNGVLYFHHTDDLDNVMALTDSAGNVVERYDYDDFGKLKFYNAAGGTLPVSAIGNPILFNGRRYDPSTGLYYYRTRYLDPAAGRFTTRDRIGIWGDDENLGNASAYVANNPWSAMDPTGESKKSRQEKRAARKEKREEKRAARKENRQERRQARKVKRDERRAARKARVHDRRLHGKAWWQVAVRLFDNHAKPVSVVVRFSIVLIRGWIAGTHPGKILKKGPFYGKYCGKVADDFKYQTVPPGVAPIDDLDQCCYCHDDCAKAKSVAIATSCDESDCNKAICECARAVDCSAMYPTPSQWSEQQVLDLRNCRAAKSNIRNIFCNRKI